MMAASAPTPARVGQHLPVVERRGTVRLRLWLPLTPLFWLLSPFALLLAPLAWAWLSPATRPSRPYAAAFAFGALLVSLSGTVVDIDAPGARLSIRIF